MARMFWQRCPSCSRLVLTRLGVATPCACVRDRSAPAVHDRISDDWTPPVRPTSLSAAGAPGSPNPVDPASLVFLTAEQDARARRLLATVFPAGFDL